MKIIALQFDPWPSPTLKSITVQQQYMYCKCYYLSCFSHHRLCYHATWPQPASPCLQAARSQPGPPPPAESPWPSCAEEQTRGSSCRNSRPERACTCCSWSASWQRGSAFSEPASCPVPRTPREKTTVTTATRKDRAEDVRTAGWNTEYLNNSQCGWSDWIWEISSRGRHTDRVQESPY